MHPIRTKRRFATKRNIGNRYSATRFSLRSRRPRPNGGKRVVSAPATPVKALGQFRFHCASIPGFATRPIPQASSPYSPPPRTRNRASYPGGIHCNRPLLQQLRSEGRTGRTTAPAPSIPERTFFVRRLKFDNACSAALITARQITRTNSHRHKNIRLSKSLKALPGLMIGN